jgi:Ca-activated chloride channel family protein
LIRIFSRRILFSPARAFALAAIAMLFSPALTQCVAQDATPPPQQVIQVSSELVKLDVSVLDKHGDFAGGLEKKDFRILDNGAAQPIIFFAPVNAPAQILVVVETSPAVYLIHDEHLIATYALLDGLAPDDQVGLATYDQAPHLLLPFTSDKHALLDALGRMQFMLGMGELNFYDSVSNIIDSLLSSEGKRALVLLTTGLDSSTPARWDALAQKLRAQDVVIYSVALGGSLRNYTGKKTKPAKKSTKPIAPEEEPAPDSGGSLSFARANEALLSLATITGGRAYFPEAPDDFVAIYREIASALRHQYVLGISPEHDGQFHSLTVQMLGSNGQPVAPATKKPEYRIYSRQGYLAPGP